MKFYMSVYILWLTNCLPSICLYPDPLHACLTYQWHLHLRLPTVKGNVFRIFDMITKYICIKIEIKKKLAGTSRRRKNHANHHKVKKEMSYLCELEEFLHASSPLTSAKDEHEWKIYFCKKLMWYTKWELPQKTNRLYNPR